MIAHLFLSLMAHVFPYNTKKVSCPPGPLLPNDDRRHIVVATMARSGTHLMIDFLLNNFPAYRHSPLYVDLDQYLKKNRPLPALSGSGGQILKTHFPEFGDANTEVLKPIFQEAFLIVVTRDSDDVRRSMKRIPEWKGMMKNFDENSERFRRFWSQWAGVLRVDFQELVDPSNASLLAEKISDHVGVPFARPLTPAPYKDEKLKIYCAKTLTRLFGAHAPLINTTIGFAKK